MTADSSRKLDASLGAQRVAFHVPAHDQEMVVHLNRKRLEPSLVQVAAAGGLMMGMPELGVRLGESAGEARQVAVAARPDDQVPVVGHEAVGEQPHGQAWCNTCSNAS